MTDEWLPPSPKPGGQWRERNAIWKGGRTIASNGYVLVKVPPDHHLADARGYAYEHRLKAEKTIGRRLLPGEIVHHKDENKINNDPSNLEVLSGKEEHGFRHRIRKDKRIPGEANDLICCECGCGIWFEKFDKYGRPRRFISGHNAGGKHG